MSSISVLMRYNSGDRNEELDERLEFVFSTRLYFSIIALHEDPLLRITRRTSTRIHGSLH